MIKASELRKQQQALFTKDNEAEMKKVENLILEAVSNKEKFVEEVNIEGDLSEATVKELEEQGYKISYGVCGDSLEKSTHISWKEDKFTDHKELVANATPGKFCPLSKGECQNDCEHWNCHLLLTKQ